MVLCRGSAILCILFSQCNSYRMMERQTQALHEQEDELNPWGTQTRQMFKGVTRSFNRFSNMNHMYRSSLFRHGQRNLHLRAAPFKPNLIKNFHQMQRYQNVGKYKFSTFPGRKPTKLPQTRFLMPMFARRLMSTAEAKQFGKVFKDYMAKRDMKAARRVKGGTKGGRCTPQQMEQFQKRFYQGGSAIAGGLSYAHPTSKFTSLYIVTSKAGDHNGAFAGLEGGVGQQGFWNMCARLLQMSSLYNVVYKRVKDLADATAFVKQVKSDPKFVKDGKALKHVTISGHGNPSTLVLGEERMLSRELMSGGETGTKKLLKELKPVLIHEGEARSTVFLDSCSTGKVPKNGGDPLAQLVAEELPGVEVHAFQEVMYPKHVQLAENFVEAGKFQCQWSLKGKCQQAAVFMAKKAQTVAEGVKAFRNVMNPPYSLVETSSNSSNSSDDELFVFYDGVSFVGDPQMCAEWCGMIPDCRSFQFVDLMDDESDDLGMCVLKAWPSSTDANFTQTNETVEVVADQVNETESEPLSVWNAWNAWDDFIRFWS